jgi:hypothetical protein
MNIFKDKGKTELLKWCIPLAVTFFLLLYRLSDVAGLHRDEATFGLFAEAIQKGLRPICGFFNFYTAPIHSYIIAFTFSILKESIWSLRISGVLFNIIAVFFYIDILRRIIPQYAKTTFWLLVTLPSFVVLSRIAGENYALNPFFLFGGIWFFYVLGGKQLRFLSNLGYLLCGLFFYLGTWNHIVFFFSALSVTISYIIFSKVKIKSLRNSLSWFILGVILGSIPRLYGIIFFDFPILPGKVPHKFTSFYTAFLNMVYTLGGDALFNRACGKTIFSLNWFLPMCVILSSFVIFFKREILAKKIWLAVFFCIALNFLGICLITPDGLVGSRLWLLPLWLVPLLLATGLKVLGKKIYYLAITIIVLVNIYNLSINYFYNFLSTGGLAKEKVYVGGKYDNSWDFIDMRPLVEKIKNSDTQRIYIEDYGVYRLVFLSTDTLRAKIRTLTDFFSEQEEVPDGSLVILYRRQGKEVSSSPVVVGDRIISYQPSLSTFHYIVFKVQLPDKIS